MLKMLQNISISPEQRCNCGTKISNSTRKSIVHWHRLGKTCPFEVIDSNGQHSDTTYDNVQNDAGNDCSIHGKVCPVFSHHRMNNQCCEWRLTQQHGNLEFVPVARFF